MGSFRPGVLPDYFGPSGVEQGRNLSNAIGTYIGQKRTDRFDDLAAQEAGLDIKGKQSDIDYQTRIRPLEEALFRAQMYKYGVRFPGDAAAGVTGQQPPGAQPSRGHMDFGGRDIDPGFAAPRLGGGHMDFGGDPGFTAPRLPGTQTDIDPGFNAPFSRPGQFNPQTGQHNPAVPLGGGFSYEDPTQATMQHYKGMGLSDDEAAMAAQDPRIAERILQDRTTMQHDETPAQRYQREVELEKMRHQFRMSERTEAGVGRGGLTMQQALDWADRLYNVPQRDDEGNLIPVLPSQIFLRARRMYQGDTGSSKQGGFRRSFSTSGPTPSTAQATPEPQPTTKPSPAPSTPTPAGVPTPAPATAAPAAPVAPAGQTLTGDAAIKAAADTLGAHPDVSDVQAHRILLKHGFKEPDIARVLRLRRRGHQP